MRVFEASAFTTDRPWAAIDIARIDDASVRLHWTDQPCIGHENDGPEVFVVLDGKVHMQFLENGEIATRRLKAGHIFCAAAGDARRATPIGHARILVVERARSV